MDRAEHFKNIMLPKLTDEQERPMRVAAFCYKSPQNGVSPKQVEFYSSLVSNFPNWTFIGCYAGRESAKPIGAWMGGLSDMLYYCEKGKIDMILVRTAETLKRNTADFVYLAKRLRDLRHPVGIYVYSINFYTLQKNADIILTFLFSLAALELNGKGNLGEIEYFRDCLRELKQEIEEETQNGETHDLI